MKRLHYICVTALIIASLLFLATLQHHHTQSHQDLTFAKVVSTITDAAVPGQRTISSSNPKFVPDSGAITEERAIIISVLFSIFLCIGVIFFVFWERRISNKSDFQLQLIAAAIILGTAFLALAFRFGIF